LDDFPPALTAVVLDHIEFAVLRLAVGGVDDGILADEEVRRRCTSTADGLALTKAFMLIKNGKLKRCIVGLVDQIAGDDDR
jgi:hypothetical protein